MPDPNGLDSSLLDEFREYFISLATFQTVPETANPDGQPVPSTPVNVSGLVNIPARKMPAFLAGTRSVSVQDRPDYTIDHNLYQLDLFGYFPQIVPAMLAVVDGVTHRIIGPVGDGNKIKTDLRIELITQ